MPYQSRITKAEHFYQTGFTLIEMLVVLIIVAMVSSVLFQALERAYRLQERFGTELFKVQQGQMTADWYRQSIQGLYPDYADGSHVFQGKYLEFSGLSTNPLSDNYGSPTPITWKLRRNTQTGTTELLYVEVKRETPILEWGSNQVRFIYVDEQHNSYESWPPPLGVATQLPKQIQLEVKEAGEITSIVASPLGPTTTLPRLQDFQ